MRMNDTEYTMKAAMNMTLYAGKKHHKYILDNCPADSTLQAIGVRDGLQVSIVAKQPMNGPIVIRVKKRDIALDKALADRIDVKVLD